MGQERKWQTGSKMCMQYVHYEMQGDTWVTK